MLHYNMLLQTSQSFSYMILIFSWTKQHYLDRKNGKKEQKQGCCKTFVLQQPLFVLNMVIAEKYLAHNSVLLYLCQSCPLQF